MFKFLWRNEDGIVLPLAVVMVAVLTLLGFSAFFMVDTQAGFTKKSITKTDALHYAEAGIHDYLGHVNRKINKPWNRWDTIPFEDGYYRLEPVDYDEHSLTRVIRSTGWTSADPDNRRTIQVTIGRNSFNQYAYFSHNDGSNILWVTGEKCYGPYHTNGTLRISGSPTFFGPVTYSTDVTGVGSNASKIFKAGYSKVPVIQMPQDNYQLKEKAKERGHYYSGRTRILLKGNKYEVVYFETTTNSNGRPTYQEVRVKKELPDNGVIYVDGGNNGKFARTSGNLFISGTLSGYLTVGAANEIYITGYDPTINNWSVAEGMPTQGLIYQSTSFYPVNANGERTSNMNDVVGYEADTSRGDDMLGLVANRDIKILGIGWFNNTNPSSGGLFGRADPEYDVAPSDITIHGAVFSVTQGFGYEAYNIHSKKKIVLRGSLIQQTRKKVGRVDGSGYRKDYAHDPRMLTSSPPNFPEPLNTGWEIKSWEEI